MNQFKGEQALRKAAQWLEDPKGKNGVHVIVE
jgi:hypothetical protein